jgi:dihydroorotate dehydrogenase (NAD+) catalytic subunit
MTMRGNSTLIVRAENHDSGPDSVDMSTSLVGVAMPSPILTASGCAASGKELSAFFDLNDIGAVVTKSIMLAPRSGRPTPRMAETPSGMLNSIGLQGPGIDAFIEHDLAWLAERGIRTVVSIAGSTVDDYPLLAERLRGVPGIAAIEVNISCPNVASRGQVFACDPDASSMVISSVRRTLGPDIPVLAKLSPDVTDIVRIARSCVDAGADGLSLINTVLGLVIDVDRMRPALAGVTGGLSGPAIRPIALRCIWQVRTALPEVPILGMGGVRTGLDALQFILAGASAVSVGTAVFGDPSAPVRIHRELAVALAARGFSSLSDAVSYAHRGPDPLPTPTTPLPVDRDVADEGDDNLDDPDLEDLQ